MYMREPVPGILPQNQCSPDMVAFALLVAAILVCGARIAPQSNSRGCLVCRDLQG